MELLLVNLKVGMDGQIDHCSNLGFGFNECPSCKVFFSGNPRISSAGGWLEFESWHVSTGGSAKATSIIGT